jgi:methylthioxylose transferase
VWRVATLLRLARLLPPLVLALVAVTFAVGLTLDERGERLGTPRPPMAFDVDARAQLVWVLVAVVLLAAAVVVAPRLRALPRPAPFALGVLGLALVVRLAVGAVRTGPEGWDEPWNESFNAKNEYVPALPAIEQLGVRFFLDRFDEILPALPVHTAGHPPGFVLVLHWLGLDTPGSATALAILLGALAVPATYLVARRLLDEERARTAGLLSALACGTTLYGVTTADVVYAAMGAGAAVLLLAAPRVAAVGGGAALAVASFFSYAVLALGAWAALVRLLRDGWRTALAVAAGCGVALVVFYVALWALTGFELHEVVIATEETYRESVARLRPYAFWLFGSPAAFLAFMGLPITWYAAKALGAREPAAVALAIVIVISAVGGFTKAETERIWLMYVPLACVAAAAVLPRERVPLVLGLLAIQSLAVELIFGTVW